MYIYSISCKSTWLIRAPGWIWGSIVHQNNHEARIHQDLFERYASPCTRVSHFSPVSPLEPRTGLHQLRLARPIRSVQVVPCSETNTISTLSHEWQRTTVPSPGRYTASSATTLTAPQLPQVLIAMVMSAPNTSSSSPPIALPSSVFSSTSASRRHWPVAPKRSVLTFPAGYPSPTRPAATDSTKLVGPQT